MAPNLAESQHAQIRDMILSERPTAEIADVAGCSTRAIYRINKTLPEDIREQLYAEAQQSLERRQKATNTSTANLPPINITNVLPAHS